MTKRAFVVGHPITHSRSPLIHRTWLRQYGIDGNYDPVDVTPETLPGFLDRIRGGEFVGGNVTVPLKEHAFELVDFHDVDTCHIRAYNTLTTSRTSDGVMVAGRNTDLHGFLANLDQQALGWDEDLDHAIILGAGGAARAVAAGLNLRVREKIFVLNRTLERAQALRDDLHGKLEPLPLDSFAQVAPGASLLVNTSTVGMDGSGFEGLDLGLLSATALVTDIVYTPLETPLLASARARGLRTVDGLGMLLHQAVPGFEAWFGVRPEVTPELRRAVEATL